ncbi:outer membrane beta-barrel protein [Xanthocytophaga flava]|uniref:outer membrane beta-barrel protein n=1 Tax=Xanthocytophaga flava TaxID=3048013 RepID=UPI0028D132CB|nr:outer membrane beta-barrel protein [Xanthocytophaga flavus]MDJ1473321.1 outer membrane beta-barrel protein [Xanthocytophaga flavus]
MTKLFYITLSFFIISLLSLTDSLAQTQKGRFMVGTSAGEFKFGKNNTDLLLDVKGGYFLIDNLVVGVTPSFGYMSYNQSESYPNSYSKSTQKGKQWGIGPFVRYYFSEHKLKPLVNASFLYYKYSVKTTSEAYIYPGFFQKGSHEIKSEYKLLQIGGGVSYFIDDRIAIEGLLNYGRYMDYEGTYDKKGEISINLGVQFFIGK